VEKFVEIQWQDRHDATCYDEAIVEYTCVDIDENGFAVHEITNVFLPMYVPEEWQALCKQQARDNFDLT
jgi:hypothetical protein